MANWIKFSRGFGYALQKTPVIYSTGEGMGPRDTDAYFRDFFPDGSSGFYRILSGNEPSPDRLLRLDTH